MVASRRFPLLVLLLSAIGLAPVHAQNEAPEPLTQQTSAPPTFSLFDCLPTAPTQGTGGFDGRSLFEGFDFPYDVSPFPGQVEGEEKPEGQPSPPSAPISGNPAATNIEIGTGTLGKILGVDQYGIRVGGVWLYDENANFRGGVQPGGWAGQEMFTTEISLDLEKLCGWRGAKFAADVLQHNGSPASGLTGDVMGFDGLDGGPPLRRTELYQLWFLQHFFDNRLAIRIGKQVTTFQFLNISGVTSLIGAPVFVMPTVLGRLPAYTDSAYGVMVEAFPTDHLYGFFGAYDGRLGGSGTPTGLRGPRFSGQYFYISEAGSKYTLGGANKLEGKVGLGVWYQTQAMPQFGNSGIHHGEAGYYLIATQQLWNANPGVETRGIAAFFQFSRSDPRVQLVPTYLGGGLTWDGLWRRRPQDSAGIGLFWGDLTNAPGAGNIRANETTIQCYYQAELSPNWFVQPVLTYINDPGSNRNLANPLALTLRCGLVF
jgi:porin